MSGIVGFLNLDGALIEHQHMLSMTRRMTFRGPDGIHTWVGGNVGLGTALLTTNDDTPPEQQPVSFDGAVWLVSDARVDDKKQLLVALKSAGRSVESDASDAELILHSYLAWGSECVRHITGDFSFAVWDGRRRALFCARDHVGVKPFFYSHNHTRFAFSNTLNVLRLTADCDRQLYAPAIADFLLFRNNECPDRTFFASIYRLPPAHTLTVSEDGTISTRRYWSVPTSGAIHYKHAEEYVDHFADLFSTAVADRLRCRKVAVWMSGGLDSSSVAAIARRTPGLDLTAHTMVYRHRMPDSEGHFATIVAEHLGIPVRFLAVDDHEMFCPWNLPKHFMPEPVDNPLAAIIRDLVEETARTARVALNGDGGDLAFMPSGTYLAAMLRQESLASLAGHFGRLWLTLGRLPPIGIRTWVRRLAAPSASRRHRLPEWLEYSTARRELNERLQTYDLPVAPGHPRSDFLASIEKQMWSVCFEQHDPGSTGFPVEFRYPFFDRRILEFVAAIPPIPWCVQKYLLRLTVRGTLPRAIVTRPKTRMVTSGAMVRREQVEAGWTRWRAIPAPSSQLLDMGRFPTNPPQSWAELDWALRALSLNWWFENAALH